MKLYRAVAKNNLEINQKIFAKKTKRVPSNIPYVIDNIWEFLRPEIFPSRRFAIYASSTKEMAFENASAVGSNKDDYQMTEIVCDYNNIKICQLKVSDARYHEDISALARLVQSYLGKDFGSLSLKENLKHAPLFLPGVSKEDLRDYFKSLDVGESMENELRKKSTFWLDASKEISPQNGELFFELINDGYYELKLSK